MLFYVKQRSSCWFSNLMDEIKTLMATDSSPSSVLGHAQRHDRSSLVYEDGCSSSSVTSERHEDADPCNNSSPPGPVNNDAFIREGEGRQIETPLGTFKLRNHKNSCDEDLSGPSSCTSCSRSWESCHAYRLAITNAIDGPFLTRIWTTCLILNRWVRFFHLKDRTHHQAARFHLIPICLVSGFRNIAFFSAYLYIHICESCRYP